MKQCPGCVLNYYQTPDGSDFFTKSCGIPHVVVWAKMPSFPWWPAKLLTHVEGKGFLWFFGAEHETAILGFACLRFLTCDAEGRMQYPGGFEQLQMIKRNSPAQALKLESAVTSVHKYTTKLVAKDSRLRVFWPKSEEAYDGRTLTFPVEDLDSMSEESFFKLIFSTRKTTRVPSKFLPCLLQQKQWIQSVSVTPLDPRSLSTLPQGLERDTRAAVLEASEAVNAGEQLQTTAQEMEATHNDSDSDWYTVDEEDEEESRERSASVV